MLEQNGEEKTVTPLLDIRILNYSQRQKLCENAIRGRRWRPATNELFKSHVRNLIDKQYAEIDEHYKYTKLKRNFKFNNGLIKKLFPEKLKEIEDQLEYPKRSLNWDVEYKSQQSEYNSKMLCAFPYQIYRDNMNGADRLKIAFLPWIYNEKYSRNEASIYNYNWRWILKMSANFAIAGGIIQGIGHGKAFQKSYDNRGKNKYVFESTGDAMMERRQSFLGGFTRYFLRWSWRIALLTGTFLTVSEMLTVYHLESKQSHYLAGGFVAGGFYKWLHGPVKMIAIGTLGMLFAGVASIFLKNRNFRAQHYYSTIDPQVSSPYYYANLTDQQKEHANTIVDEIIHLCNIPQKDLDDNIIRECEKYVGKLDQSTM